MLAWDSKWQKEEINADCVRGTMIELLWYIEAAESLCHRRIRDRSKWKQKNKLTKLNGLVWEKVTNKLEKVWQSDTDRVREQENFWRKKARQKSGPTRRKEKEWEKNQKTNNYR